MAEIPYQVGDVIGRIKILERLPNRVYGASSTKRVWRVQCLNCGTIMDKVSSQIPRLTKGANGQLCSHWGQAKAMEDVIIPSFNAVYPCNDCEKKKNKDGCSNYKSCVRFRGWSRSTWRESVSMLKGRKEQK